MVVSRIERFSASENMCTFLKRSEGAISATKVLGSFRKMFCGGVEEMVSPDGMRAEKSDTRKNSLDDRCVRYLCPKGKFRIEEYFVEGQKNKE